MDPVKLFVTEVSRSSASIPDTSDDCATAWKRIITNSVALGRHEAPDADDPNPIAIVNLYGLTDEQAAAFQVGQEYALTLTPAA